MRPSAGRPCGGQGRPVAQLMACVALVSWNAVGQARADDQVATTAPSGQYAFGVDLRLRAAPAVEQLQYDGRSLGLPLDSGTVEVRSQARVAYALTLDRMFHAPAAGDAALVLEVAVTMARIGQAGTAGRAHVEHEIVARKLGGEEIARWSVRGDEAISGYDHRSVSLAFSRAATQAAKTFEEAFDRSEPVGAWLKADGFVRRIPPVPPPRFVPRTGTVAYLDVGPGLAPHGQLALAARAGISGERFFLALNLTRVSSSFTAAPPFGYAVEPATIDATLVGLDAGVILRLLGAFELRAGVGVHRVGGPATVRYYVDNASYTLYGTRQMKVEKWVDGGSAFAAFLWTTSPMTVLKVRGRLGVEVRNGLGGRLRYDAYRATIEVPGLVSSVLFGVELPLP